MANQPSQDLHNRGWGFALLIIIIAIAANLSVYMHHKRTYLQPPRDAAQATAPAAAKAH